MKLGTYAVEQDYSQYVARASEITLAIVGTAKKGPIGVPTVCTSVIDFVNKFGNLCTDCLGLYTGQYALSKMSKIYYVRAATSAAAEATTTIPGTSVGDVEIPAAITLKAKYKGTYYNDYTVVISNVVTVVDDKKFTLIVRNAEEKTVETITDISLSSLATTVSDVRIASPEALTSKYVNLSAVSPVAANTIAAGTYTLSGGNDGIADISAAEYIAAGNLLANDNLDFNLFAIPGVSDASVIHAMLSMAEVRGDCLYLIDPPNNLDFSGVADWHNGGGDYEHVKFNSSYGAVYWSWQRIYDAVNKVYIEIPPSAVVAPVIADSVAKTEIWYAPAGLQRGTISGVLEPVTTPTNTERDYLYSGENSVNCIINDPQVGLCVFGQKTLYRQDTALNRVNVRMLLNYLKRVITAACRHLTFEPNDRVTWNYFEDKVEPTLRGIQDHRGIYEYQIVKGDRIVTGSDIDNYRMPCMILIRPTKSAEDIPIYFTITSTGADFNDVLSYNGIIVDEY